MGNESGSVSDMTNVRKLVGAASAAACAAALAAFSVLAMPATSHADPAGHQVTYTITATGNLTGTVRYMNSDPPSQAAYDANSAQFLNTAQTAITADPLVYTATLTNPNQWGYVNAIGACKWPDCTGSVAEIRCEIAVDGQVVVTNTATTTVTCATRPS